MMAVSTVTVDFSAILQTAANATGTLRVRLSQVGTVEDSETGETVVIPISWQEVTLSQGAASLSLIPNALIEPSCTYYDVQLKSIPSCPKECARVLLSGIMYVPNQNCSIMDILISPKTGETPGTASAYASQAKEAAVEAQKSADEASRIVADTITEFTVAGDVAVYYVDAVDGDDAQDGLSQETAFQTLAPIWDIYNKGQDAVYMVRLKVGEVIEQNPYGNIYHVSENIYAIWQGSPHISTYGNIGAATMYFHSTRQYGAHFYSSRVSIGASTNHRIKILGDRLDISPEGKTYKGFFFEHCASSLGGVDFLIPVKFVGGRVGLVNCTFHTDSDVVSPFDPKRSPSAFFEGLQVKISGTTLIDTDNPYRIGVYFKNCDINMATLQETEQTYIGSNDEESDNPASNDNENESENIPVQEPPKYPLIYMVRCIAWYEPTTAPTFTAVSRHYKYLRNYESSMFFTTAGRNGIKDYYAEGDDGYMITRGMTYVDGNPSPAAITLNGATPIEIVLPDIVKGTNPSSQANSRIVFVDKNRIEGNVSRLATIVYRIGTNGDSMLMLAPSKFAEGAGSVAWFGACYQHDGVSYGQSPSTPATGNDTDIVTRDFLTSSLSPLISRIEALEEANA